MCSHSCRFDTSAGTAPLKCIKIIISRAGIHQDIHRVEKKSQALCGR